MISIERKMELFGIIIIYLHACTYCAVTNTLIDFSYNVAIYNNISFLYPFSRTSCNIWIYLAIYTPVAEE